MQIYLNKFDGKIIQAFAHFLFNNFILISLKKGMSKKCTLKTYLHTKGLTINTIDSKVVIIVLILKPSSLTSKLNDLFLKSIFLLKALQIIHQCLA